MSSSPLSFLFRFPLSEVTLLTIIVICVIPPMVILVKVILSLARSISTSWAYINSFIQRMPLNFFFKNLLVAAESTEAASRKHSRNKPRVHAKVINRAGKNPRNIHWLQTRKN